jgi:hypothetical protein
MAEPWKEGKAKGRLSPPPPAPWKSRIQREIPTFPQPWRSKLEKWKTKNRFPTFPACFATTSSVLCLPNPSAFGRQGRRSAANRTPSRIPNSSSTPNRKDLSPGLQRFRFSGSSCIGNESRFQDHPSIGICCGDLVAGVQTESAAPRALGLECPRACNISLAKNHLLSTRTGRCFWSHRTKKANYPPLLLN